MGEDTSAGRVDQFFVMIARAGDVDEAAHRFLMDTIRESSSRLPPDGRAPIVDDRIEADTDNPGLDVPACQFVARLVKQFVSRCGDLTIALEYKHIDPTYRDMYYRHYSHEFFDVDRFSLRVSFFGTILSQEDFVTAEDDVLQDSFIGSCVIGSLDGHGAVGRTLIKPEYLIDRSADVRLSAFHINIGGRKFETRAFPFRGQDGAMMRCAEVTLLNLMCYYSNEYPDYHLALPSEIAAHEQMYSNERVIPSRGLSYDRLAKILSDFRFFPRIYNIDSVGSSVTLGADLPKDVLFRRLLHWYVGSGIPVAINVAQPQADDDGHSIVCIGYEDIHTSLDGEEGGGQRLGVTPDIAEHSLRIAAKLRRRKGQGREAPWGGVRSFQLIHGADFDRDYVVVDDGLMPYALQPYAEPSSMRGFRCLNYVVPLHRSMAIDALDAYENAIHAIGHPELGMLTWGDGYFEEGEAFVLDMLMTSVRGYKRDRIGYERERYHEAKARESSRPERHGVGAQDEGSQQGLTEAEWHGIVAHTLGIAAMPHFLWVAEISRLSEYQKPREERRVFAEIVFDVTSGGAGEVVDKIVLMRYPDRIYLRSPDGAGAIMPIGLGGVDQNPIRPLRENLDWVNPLR